MNNSGMTLTQMIRGFSQYVAAAVLSLPFVVNAVDYLVTNLNVPFNATAVALVLEGILFSLISGGLGWAGQKYPLVNWLLSWGRSGSGPVYVPAGDVAVGATVTPAEGTTVFTESGTGAAAPRVFEEEPPAGRHLAP